MTQTIIIKGIKGSTSNKQGQPYLDQNGRAKTRITIEADGLPNGKKDMSTFAYQDSPVMGWKMGESHEVDITLSPDGKYVNFFPAKSEMPTYRQIGNPAAQVNLVTPTGSIEAPSGFTEADRKILLAIYTYLSREPR